MRVPTTSDSTRERSSITRRRFIAGLALLATRWRAAHGSTLTRTLAFSHTHTGERLTIAYAMGDVYAPEALARIAWFLRDFRNGAVHAIDPGVLDQLHAVARLTASRAEYEVISGYRSPATNQALRARSHGVAEHSLHLEGRAIDVRLPDVALADLRDAARSLHAGGVGFYPESNFVHIDTGRVRQW